MAAASDPQLFSDMPADHFQTLPDEVLILILSLLSFGEKVGVRLVCRKWNQAVDWMFGQQSSVRLVLRPDVCLLMEDCGWKWEQMCDHTFDPEYDFCITHCAFQHHWWNAYGRSEDAKTKRAMDRFVGGIHFVMKYFHEVSVIAAVCGFMETYFGIYRLDYGEEDRIRLKAACGELAARFGSQAKCMTIPMLDIDHTHSFPALVHLTCDHISSDITNVFETVAPKLTTLSCQQMHFANYLNLPHGFISIWALMSSAYDDGYTKGLKLILQSKGRESIRRISVRTDHLAGEGGENAFPHLQSFTVDYRSHALRKFPDCMSLSSKRLQRLALNCFKMMDNVTMNFDCLQSLNFEYSPNSNLLIQMLGKTPQLQQLVASLMNECLDEVALLSAFSLLPHLRFVDFKFFENDWESERPERTAALLTFLRGPLRAKLTFFRFSYKGHVLQMPDHVQEVMAEMRVMTQTEKLVAGGVNNWLVRKDCPHADQWMEQACDVLGLWFQV